MDDFKIRLKENKRKNDILMMYYESYLRKKRLKPQIIRKYCFNVGFYIYVYLTQDETIIPAIEGYRALKDFPEAFMTRYTWASVRNYESGIYSKEEYKIVNDFRKKEVPKFMAKYDFIGDDYLKDFIID